MAKTKKDDSTEGLTATELQKIVDKHEKTISKHEKTIDDQEKLITDLSAELEKKPSGSSDASIVTVEGKEYRIAIKKFKHLGIEKTAEDVKSDKELAKALVKRGSGVLKAI
jgi:TPP-dependent indolepyruvate ferredoxin oxidoreductase alpha subunit